jgi:threonine/homoserine/homoserine lactone efflux protein
MIVMILPALVTFVFDSLPEAKGIYAIMMACVCVYVCMCVCVYVCVCVTPARNQANSIRQQWISIILGVWVRHSE